MPKAQSGSLVLSTPCLPKRSYHCGNALSALVADLLWRAECYFRQAEGFLVSDAWNLHGLPYEKEYLAQSSRVGTYADIERFALETLGFAQKEKQALIASRGGLAYLDTDRALGAFSQEALTSLCASGFVFWREEEAFLDIAKFRSGVSYVHFVEALQAKGLFRPECHRASVAAQARIFVDGFPLSKSRVFALNVRLDGREIALNPIVQSFLYPRWVSSVLGLDPGCRKILISASGHGMLKWHYLRALFSWMSESRLPVDEFLMHGTILGADGLPMSKHASNAVSPSELIERCGGPFAARFVLLRSISEKDVPLQEIRGLREYRLIQPKLEKLASMEWRSASDGQTRRVFDRIRDAFAARRIHLAVDEWYVWLRNMSLARATNGVTSLDRVAVEISRLFLDIGWEDKGEASYPSE